MFPIIFHKKKILCKIYICHLIRILKKVTYTVSKEFVKRKCVFLSVSDVPHGKQSKWGWALILSVTAKECCKMYETDQKKDPSVREEIECWSCNFLWIKGLRYLNVLKLLVPFKLRLTSLPFNIHTINSKRSFEVLKYILIIVITYSMFLILS